MNFRYIRKKAVVLCLVTAICAGGLTGCGGNTKIVFTTGLSGNQLFKIGSATCTTPEIMVYLTTFYNQYAESYGQEMWHYDFGGISLEEHVKDVVLSKMAQIKIMNLMAEEGKITLSPEEEKRVLEAANYYYELLGEELIQQEGMTEKIVQNVFREYTLANKVYLTITESAEMEISDDEARTVTVQTIYFKTWKYKGGEKILLSEDQKLETLKTAKKALSLVNLGEEFESVAMQYSEDKQIVKSYARGSVEAHFEELLFSMDEGDVSNIIETEDGYYIIKCISTIDYEATQANKLVLAEQRKKEAFSKAYKEIATGTHSQFRDRQWEKLTLNGNIHSTEADFFKIYNEYVKQ